MSASRSRSSLASNEPAAEPAAKTWMTAGDLILDDDDEPLLEANGTRPSPSLPSRQ